MSRGRHLVVGGSAGIGYAYAQHLAQRGDALVLVARGKAGLDEAEAALGEQGAHSVRSLVVDVTRPADLERCLRACEDAPFASVFVGGPTPPVSPADRFTRDDVAAAIRAVLLYPLAVLSWASQGRVVPGGVVRYLGSAATERAMPEGLFYLSGVTRCALDDAVATLRPVLNAIRIRFEVWRPHVVYSPLARAFAITRWGDLCDEQLRNKLAKLFQSPVPTPREFVEEMMGRSQTMDEGQ